MVKLNFSKVNITTLKPNATNFNYVHKSNATKFNHGYVMVWIDLQSL